jgi:acyl-CoA synthetase (AMP-forming)/AMP-acid ligase II
LTTPTGLTDWIDRPAAEAGVSFLDNDWEWCRVSYAELADRIRRVAGALAAHGLGGQRVAVLVADPEAFIVHLFAVWAVGGTCLPVTPHLPLHDANDYRRQATAGLETARPVVLLVGEDDEAVVPDWPTLRITKEDHADPGPARSPAATDAALVQFSSGSSGTPKAIRISRRALMANIGAIARWLQMSPGDLTASWLPLYHDMGLIGTTLCPILTQTDLMVMTPMQFLRRPEAWLRCFGESGATLTAAPAFGYAYAARKISPEVMVDWDFSRWRAAIVGAEPIRRRVIDEVTACLSPFGFARRAFCPAYGLAEATLVVSATPLDELPVTRSDLSQVGDADATLPGQGELVGSGRPLEGCTVRVTDEAGLSVPDSEIGEIWVGGDALADGYEPPVEGAFVDGWFRTGDIGMVVAGELFVCGRVSDGFKVRGNRVLAEDAEFAIQKSLDLRTPPVVVPSRREGAGLTVLVESQRPWSETEQNVAHEVLGGLFDGAEVDIAFVPRGGIPRTTSGKPQRRQCWRQYVIGDG